MHETRGDLLSERERKLIDAHIGVHEIPPGTLLEEYRDALLDQISNPRDVRYRIRNGVGSSDGLRSALDGIYEDLYRIEQFHRQIREQPGGTHDWEDQILPVAEHRIKRLHELLEGWLERASQDQFLEYRDELWDALAPLRSDLEYPRMREEGEIGVRDIIRARSDHPDANPELVDEIEEERHRRKALAALLGDEELREIFLFIVGTPENQQKRVLENRSKGGMTWKYWASTNLETEHGVVVDSMPDRNSTRGFEVTDRGEAVADTLRGFKHTDILPDDVDDDELYRWALRLLRRYHGGERW